MVESLHMNLQLTLMLLLCLPAEDIDRQGDNEKLGPSHPHLWKNLKVPGLIRILILDAYCIHVMGTIVNQMPSLGIEVIHMLYIFVLAH